MTYNETIEYLYQHLPMFSRIGAAAYKKDLHNTIELCKALGNPEQKFRSIHVAGTNGKGSTSHMLAAVLQEAGYKTGLYTSPHIKDFGERIRINGKMIRQDFVIDFVKKTQQLSDDIQPSFFELTVAMAFEYFAIEAVDIAVIETGLGGRLDSTNVISPVLSVITNIGYDHMNLLGNTLPAIALEKAGIIKRNTPVVIGETLPETKAVFADKAKEMNADIYFTEERFSVSSVETTKSSLNCKIENKISGQIESFNIDLAGLYQAKNTCTVLNAIDILLKTGFDIPRKALHDGLSHVTAITGLRGRWEIKETNPLLILDVAHNEDGIRQVLQQLEINYPNAQLHFIVGFVNDKDVRKALSLFPSTAKYYFTNAHIPRAMQYETLKELAGEKGLRGEGFDDVNDAIRQAKNNATKNDVIMVCGSFFIIAEVD